MNSLDDRKKGFEAKYQRDEEAQFKIKAIRNKLIGQWAADLINPEDQEVYIKEVRLSDLEKPGDEDIIEKLLNDFNSKKLNIEKSEIIKKIEECETNALKLFNDQKK
tara:strand:- start:48 stop:368 length:321 start_codon:yes stop_codon:yes gene_type:complete